jgi:hypothetical protein
MGSVPSFQVALNFDLIRSIRLLHALLECDGDVRANPLERREFTKLRDVFGMFLEEEVEDVPVLPGLEFDHERPATQVGRIERPLVVAQGMVERCRSLWQRPRLVRASFAGRLHRERQTLLHRWLDQQYPNAEKDRSSQTAVDHRVQLRKTIRAYRSAFCEDRFAGF